MTIAIEVLMLLSSLLLVVGGFRAQSPHGATMLSVVGVGVVFAILVYSGAVRDVRVELVAGAALLFAAFLYVRAYRRSHRPRSA